LSTNLKKGSTREKASVSSTLIKRLLNRVQGEKKLISRKKGRSTSENALPRGPNEACHLADEAGRSNRGEERGVLRGERDDLILRISKGRRYGWSGK